MAGGFLAEGASGQLPFSTNCTKLAAELLEADLEQILTIKSKNVPKTAGYNLKIITQIQKYSSCQDFADVVSFS